MRKWHVRIDKKKIFFPFSYVMVAAISEMKILSATKINLFLSCLTATVLMRVSLKLGNVAKIFHPSLELKK